MVLTKSYAAMNIPGYGIIFPLYQTGGIKQ
jgi:hypothetical protein